MNAYNPYSYLQQPQQMYPTQMSGSNDERIWVQGLASAEAYLVAPNSFVRLWDSTTNRFYEKRADATGRPFSLEAYEYKRVEASNQPLTNEVKQDYEEEIKRLEARVEALEKSTKKEVKRNATKSNADDSGVPEV